MEPLKEQVIINDKELEIEYKEVSFAGLTENQIKESSIFGQVKRMGLNEYWFDSNALVLDVDDLMNVSDYKLYVATTRVPQISRLKGKEKTKLKNKVLGFVVCDKRNDDEFFPRDKENINKNLQLDFICVDPKFRGHGIGTKLINYVLEDLQMQTPLTFLKVHKDNFKAANLYMKFGFREVESAYSTLNLMCRLNNEEIKLLSDIACKGIEYVYMNSGREELKRFFSKINKKPEVVGASKLQIDLLNEKYPFGIKLIKEWVFGLKKFKDLNPNSTYGDYIAQNSNPYCNKPFLKSTKVMKNGNKKTKEDVQKIIYIAKKAVEMKVSEGNGFPIDKNEIKER